MVPKLIDTYEKWQQVGILKKKLKTVQELTAKRINQSNIAEVLGVSERTLIKLKRAHPKLNQAFIFGNDELKYKLVDTMLKKAMGFEYEETQTTIEETKAGTKKKIVKTKKKSLPDFNAIKYLLIVKFGRDFNERREEIDLMYKKNETKSEVWIGESSDDSNTKYKRIPKQSKK